LQEGWYARRKEIGGGVYNRKSVDERSKFEGGKGVPRSERLRRGRTRGDRPRGGSLEKTMRSQKKGRGGTRQAEATGPTDPVLIQSRNDFRKKVQTEKKAETRKSSDDRIGARR